MQHALKHVERPGGSHEGVGRKKKLRQLLLLQVCQRTRFFWIVMGRHDFLDCIALH